MTCNFVSEISLGSRGPLKELEYKLKKVRAVRPPSEVGKIPKRLFVSISKIWSDVKRPSCVGRLLEILLHRRVREVKALRFPILVGRDPPSDRKSVV
jgi:hypothetical protein